MSEFSTTITKLTNKFIASEAKPDCITNGDAVTVSDATTETTRILYLRIFFGTCGDDVVPYGWPVPHEDCDGSDDAVCPGLCSATCTCP